MTCYYVIICKTCPVGCYLNYAFDATDDCHTYLTFPYYNCVSCPTYCTSCQSASTCTGCVIGYGLDSSNSCVSCGSLFGTGCL